MTPCYFAVGEMTTLRLLSSPLRYLRDGSTRPAYDGVLYLEWGGEVSSEPLLR